MKSHSLKIYNTLSGKKEAFKPLKSARVLLFVCGPTVYDFSHIGHARTCIIFDCFAKYLHHLGYTVTYVQNITDIDDKIIAKAKEKGVSAQDLADAFEKEYYKDMKALGITSVTKYAPATNYIKEIIRQVETLGKLGYAYRLDDGIYYDIGKFKPYGKLSGRTALQAEDSISRIDYHAQKKNRGDFCLWKFNEHLAGEPSWPSPFGNGRPGWHIEDTAISEKFFGPQYDIHGGGRDLIFPHHEAEIAQMEAISSKHPMARYWMHTGFLTVDSQKMSKSLQNSIVINEFLQRHSPEQLRFWVARSLWRSPINYSEESIMEAKVALEKMSEFLRKIKATKAVRVAKAATEKDIKRLLETAQEEFYQNLADDFNTPKAFATIFDFIKEVNTLLATQPITKKEAAIVLSFFKEINDIFGIIDFKRLTEGNIPKEVELLVQEREECRKQANWHKSDELRLEIEKYGFLIEDTKEGPTLKKIFHT